MRNFAIIFLLMQAILAIFNIYELNKTILIFDTLLCILVLMRD